MVSAFSPFHFVFASINSWQITEKAFTFHSYTLYRIVLAHLSAFLFFLIPIILSIPANSPLFFLQLSFVRYPSSDSEDEHWEDDDYEDDLPLKQLNLSDASTLSATKSLATLLRQRGISIKGTL